MDVAGDVVSVGGGVDEALIGTAVVPRYLQPDYQMVGVQIPGGYAEYVKVSAASLVTKPDTLSYEEAAATPLPFSTTWHALVTRGALQSGETVLVNAASGAVGTSAVQVAKHLGARVIACGGDDRRLERSRELGADEVVNARTEDLASRVRELTDGAGVDLVLEPLGGEILQQSLKALAFNGRVVTLGSITGDDVSINVPDLYLGQHSLIGSVGASFDEIDRVIEIAAQGAFKPVIDRILPLEQAAEAHGIIERREVFGRILLAP
jgi:NADPH2:quinone reductase